MDTFLGLPARLPQSLRLSIYTTHSHPSCPTQVGENLVSSSSLAPRHRVLPDDASKVTASGPGLSSYGVPASLPVEFAIDARDAGEGLLAVQITVIGSYFPESDFINNFWVRGEYENYNSQSPTRYQSVLCRCFPP